MSDDLGDRIDKAVKTLVKRKIKVGIPSDAKQEGPGSGKAPPLYVLGYINEFGDYELQIPPRPFLVPGIDLVRDKITDGMKKAAAAAFAGDLGKADAFLDATAAIAAAGPKRIISEGQLTPLSPRTIYNRRHRKGPPGTPDPVDRTNPLLDQGDLQRSIIGVVGRR